MQVIKIFPEEFASNSYILTADGKRAVVIDCAEPRVFDKCTEAGLKPEWVLLTHGHFDHVGGCGKFFEKGVKICCGEREKPLIFSPEYLGMFGGVSVPEFAISRVFSDGEEAELCGINFKVIATPGHSAGSVSYLSQDCLFTGDTLFRGSVGRCDLPTGNAKELAASVQKLYALDGDYKVYCGHDADTTLESERKFNLYIRQNQC